MSPFQLLDGRSRNGRIQIKNHAMLVMTKMGGDAIEIERRASCVVKKWKMAVNSLGRRFLRGCARLPFQRLNVRGCAMVYKKNWFLAYFKRVLWAVKG